MKDQPMKHLRIIMHSIWTVIEWHLLYFWFILFFHFLILDPQFQRMDGCFLILRSEQQLAAGQQFRNYIFSIAAPLFVFGTSGDGIPASWAGAQNHKFVRTENAIFKNGVFKKTSFYNNNTWTTSNFTL